MACSNKAMDTETDLEVADTEYVVNHTRLAGTLGRGLLSPWSNAIAVLVGLTVGGLMGYWVNSALELEKEELRGVLTQGEETGSEALQRRADLEREVEALRSELDVVARSAAEPEAEANTTDHAEIAFLGELDESGFVEQSGPVVLKQEAKHPVDLATAPHEIPPEDAVVVSPDAIDSETPSQERDEAELEAAREQEALIESLLAQAENDLQALRLTTPAGSNALERYQAVRKLQPDHPLARQGLEQIVARYAQLAQRAIIDGQYATAEEFLRRADSIQPNAEATMRIRQQMAENGIEIREQDSRLITNKISKPLKVAIFPFASSGTCSRPVEPGILEAATDLVRNDPSVVLAYSFYSDERRKQVVPRTQEVWEDDVTRKVPVIDAVYELGERLGVDGVLMSWIECSAKSERYEEWFPFEVYLFDTKKQRIYYKKDLLSNLSTGTGKVFVDFVNERTQNARTR